MIWDINVAKEPGVRYLETEANDEELSDYRVSVSNHLIQVSIRLFFTRSWTNKSLLDSPTSYFRCENPSLYPILSNDNNAKLTQSKD